MSCRRSVLSTKCLSTKICRRNVLSTKCSVDEMLVDKKFVDEMSCRRNVLSTKCLSTKICRQNVSTKILSTKCFSTKVSLDERHRILVRLFINHVNMLSTRIVTSIAILIISYVLYVQSARIRCSSSNYL
jgi:hypothetical protein